MHLKSIELVGFKSFAERTFIELKEGISGVVGPNGCGKSNIVDAARWCLGEMSAKSLRSKQMQDVIFAGAAGRTALNMAEVTLTFDNAHRLLPTDYSEVQVTRKLFRSGESEYFLNKTQCRLKDIRDLFLDTGLGEGYSILAQGEVDFVINAKPEERRELFEEAAGVSKYKARREETLRKLEKVELDITRLNDVIALVKEQMDSLDTAVKKAKLYEKLREELKTLEITDSLSQLQNLEERIQTAQKRLDELQKQIQEATVATDTSEAELTQIRLQQDAYEKQLNDERNALQELEKQISSADHASRLALENEQQFVEQEKIYKEQIRTAQENRIHSQTKLKEVEEEFFSSQTTAQQLTETIQQERQAKQRIETERKDLEKELDKMSEQVLQIAGEMSELQNEKNSCSSLNIQKQSESSSAKKECDKILQDQTKLIQEVEGLNLNLQNFESAASGNEKDSAQLKEKLLLEQKKRDEFSKQIQSLRSAVIQKETQLNSLLQAFENNPYRKGTQALLKQGFPGLKGVVGILFKYSENMGQWIESALGHKMNFLVFEHLPQAQKALDWLKEKGLGRATCIILDRIPTVMPLDLTPIPNANSLLSFVQCSPELEKLKNYLLGAAFLTGNTLYDTGTIDGGSDAFPLELQRNESSLLTFFPDDLNASTQNQFLIKEKLETVILQDYERLKHLELEFTTVENEIENTKTGLAEKEMELGKIQIEKNHIQERLNTRREEIEIGKRELAFFQEKQAQDTKEIAERTAGLNQLEQKLSLLGDTKKEREEERNKVEKKIKEKQEEERRVEIHIKEIEVRLELLEENLNKSQGALDELQKGLEQCEKTIQKTKVEIETCQHKIAQCQKIQKEESAKVQELEKGKIEISNQVDNILEQKSELDQKSNSLLTTLQGLREKQNQMAGFSHQLDIDLKTEENEKRNILRRLEETYQLTPQQAREQLLLPGRSEGASPEGKDESAAPPVLKSVDPEAIMKLRKKIETMSHAVNLEAPQQYQQLEERFNFLTGQTQDLTRAKEDLKNAIKQINATTKEQFKDTFEKVRDHFRKVYATLFVGGEADLVFTNEQDLLETGIEIVTQPPGKKLQNLSLLSGGEKALTAIALLFAFFLVKPSPFCILDEVDAPWDPANVDRFLKLLKEFSGKTQFLIVTHSPRTMEITDVLYGVTMEEFGVSKILSAKLKKEISKKSPASIIA